MENREELFEKIESKEKEWEQQIKYLQARVANLDPSVRTKVEEQLEYLNGKLKEIESRTVNLKKISNEVEKEVGDKIVLSWAELFTKIDDAMLKLDK